jgi:hypothetical protein
LSLHVVIMRVISFWKTLKMMTRKMLLSNLFLNSKKLYTLWNKKDIVQEAHVAPYHIKLTIWKYGVEPKQIHKWRNNINTPSVKLQYTQTLTLWKSKDS